MQILRTVIVEKKDILAMLPTGFGNSLPTYCTRHRFRENWLQIDRNSIVLVVSPLNAVVRDQVTKLRECGLKACILKGDRVALEGEDDDGERVSISEARFRRRSTHVPKLIDELSPAKERRLNQFGTAVLIRCGNVVKFDKICRIIRHWSGN